MLLRRCDWRDKMVYFSSPMKNIPWFFRAALLAGFFILSLSSPAQTAPAAAETPKPLPGDRPGQTPAGQQAGTVPAPLKDADGRTIRRAATGHLTNYYEDKVPPYTLPEVLQLQNGQPVRDAATWVKLRRPELLKLYASEIYGRVPATAPKVKWEIVGNDETVLDGKAVRKHLVGHFGDKPAGPMVNVMLYLPAAASGPVPVVLHATFGGDTSLQPPPAPVAPGATPPRRFNDAGPVADLIARGYGYAILRYAEIQADNKDGYTGGVIGLALRARPNPKPAPDEWGTISAWAWGLSRVLDIPGDGSRHRRASHRARRALAARQDRALGRRAGRAVRAGLFQPGRRDGFFAGAARLR